MPNFCVGFYFLQTKCLELVLDSTFCSSYEQVLFFSGQQPKIDTPVSLRVKNRYSQESSQAIITRFIGRNTHRTIVPVSEGQQRNDPQVHSLAPTFIPRRIQGQCGRIGFGWDQVYMGSQCQAGAGEVLVASGKRVFFTWFQRQPVSCPMIQE